MLRKLAASRATRFVSCTFLLWAFAAYMTDAKDLFLVENATMASIAVAVMVAYSRVVTDALLAPKASRANLLGLGIFFAWAGTAILRTISILLNGFNLPVAQTDFSTFGLYLQILAGVLHLSAPVLDPGGVWPVRERIKAALWSGAGVFVLLIFLVAKGN